MIFIQALFSIAWVAMALRTERSAPLLRATWIFFALATAALALARLSAFRTPGLPRAGDLVAAILCIALAILAYVYSRVRKEPQKARRWLWDRSYAD
ncbi:MAG TPA: hypothetical protein VMV73_06945 [Candidatus Dormibacteraeota bacterium]|nr:hypothetical protein [Candidatus Dormibacteraeota bacterium]